MWDEAIDSSQTHSGSLGIRRPDDRLDDGCSKLVEANSTIGVRSGAGESNQKTEQRERCAASELVGLWRAPQMQ